jgi:GT2 family glycosyltransferase
VIVPAYNAENTLDQCLSAIASSSLRPFECIVFDDGSQDRTAEIAQRHGARVLRSETRRGPAHGRNIAALRAEGEILIFVDADVLVQPDVVKRFVAAFRADPALAAVVGSYDNAPAGRGLVSAFKNLQHHFMHQSAETAGCTFWCGCGAVRRDIYLAHGGLDESYTEPSIEDIEFGLRLAHAGLKLKMDRTIQAKHLKVWSLTELIRTDILRRGIPWMKLSLRNRELPSTLNLTYDQRISVIATSVGAILMVCALLVEVFPADGPGVLTAAAACSLIAVAGLNRRFYQFLASRRGWLFALRAFPLHLLYFLYCATSAACGLISHAFADLSQHGRTFRPVAPLSLVAKPPQMATGRLSPAGLAPYLASEIAGEHQLVVLQGDFPSHGNSAEG